jgi:two-component system, chemotaxis family, CheB/CheR fusion protein
MTSAKVDPEDRILVLGPTGRDAEVACDVLTRAGIAARPCSEIREISRECGTGASALVLADEALDEDAVEVLLGLLERQPPWSALPLLLFASSEQSAGRLLEVLSERTTVTVLERPIHLSTFTSAASAALSFRKRQYEVRDFIKRLEEADRLKDQFLATLSHELRNPLNSIVGNAEILLRSPQTQSPVLHRSAEAILRNAVAQAQLIGDLLDLSRLQTGKLSLNRECISLPTVIADALETIRKDAVAKRISLEIKLPPEDLVIDGDSVRVHQVAWNLLNNAVKFTPEGGTIQLSLEREGAAAKLTVEDNGQGIDAEFLPHIFEMFRQADARSTRMHGGLGIGLALVRQLVEMQEGRVSAESNGINRGARFTVWLPLRVSADETTSLPATTTVTGELAGVRILVVDDTADTTEVMKTMLELAAAQVTTASSGAEALQLADNADFDLILSDVSMPEMDGYELLRELRKRPRTSRVPAIALTGFGRSEDITRARAAGFNSHLTKGTVR